MPVIVLLGVIPSMLAILFIASHHADKELRRDTEENIAFKARTLANIVY